MKKVLILIIAAAIGYAPDAGAQSGKKRSKQAPANKNSISQKQSQNQGTGNSAAVSLTSAESNQARGNAPEAHLSISDPTINALNHRAAGGNVPISRSGIVGMPKRAYGFANGKILLRNTTATTPGTQFGSGAVGTGTTILGLGAGENAIGVNGKNPYAGPSLWGSKLPNQAFSLPDSSRRR
jgi:hypothetical protein